MHQDHEGKDTRTLRYDWFLTSDGTECEVHEAYTGPEGLIEHNSHILEARTKLFKDYADNHFMTVYGEASQPLLELFKAHGVGFKWFYFVQGLEPAAATLETRLWPRTSRRSARPRGRLTPERREVLDDTCYDDNNP